MMDKEELKRSYQNITHHANTQWEWLLEHLLTSGQRHTPRGMSTKEVLACQTIIDMNYPVVTNKQRKLGYKFLFAEAWWILSGRCDVESIKTYGNIARFSDDGYRFQGAYGPMITEQIRYVVESIQKDPSTRQAVMTIWRPNPRDSKDIPCTVAGQWLIRNDKLHYIHTMRSSDAWLGWPYDVFNFSCLSFYILCMLKEKAEKGDFHKVTMGNMYFNAGSQHLYNENLEKARECLVATVRHDVHPMFQHYEKPSKIIRKLEHSKDSDVPLYELTKMI